MNTIQPAVLPNTAESQKGIAIVYKVTVALAIFFSILLVVYIWHLGGNPMIACGFLGAWFIHLGSRPSLKHIGWSLTAGSLVGLIYGLLGGPFGSQTFVRWMGAGAFLGTGSILVMSIDQVWTGSSKYTAALKDALILPVFSLIAGLCMQLTSDAVRPSFDFLLYRFDLSLGFEPSLAVVSLFRELPWLSSGSSLIYAGLLIFPPLYHGWAGYRGKTTKIHLMHAFVIAGVCGFVLYQVCPAIGPRYTFGQQFPDRLPALSAVPVNAFMSTSVHNAMPSMHFTWALLVWVAAWELGWFAVVFASIFVTLTGLATMGFGEHYLVDLIVAVPIVMMVQGICRIRHRWTAAGFGFAVLWMVYLRTGIVLPATVNWLFVIGTIATAVAIMSSILKVKTAGRPNPVGRVDRVYPWSGANFVAPPEDKW